MPTSLLAAVLALQGTSAAPVVLAPDQRALLRCAAAFALVAEGQARGAEDARRWPALAGRGREFFVRALAQVMDQTGLGREAIAAHTRAEARALSEAGEVDRIMPSCLTMLGAAGL